MAEVGLLGLTMVAAGPALWLQTPWAGKVTGLPSSTVLVTGVQKDWSGPASASGLFGS